MVGSINRKVFRKIYENMPDDIKKMLSRLYHLLFLPSTYFFKPFGFILKLKLEFYKFLNIPYKSDIKVKKFMFSPFGYDLIAESFNEELYKPLLGCKNVLGLGGFVGDADIYLSQKCDKIYSFEPEKFKFEIMKKNIRKNKLEKKIFPYNFAVVNSNQKRMTIRKKNVLDGAASVTYFGSKSKIAEEVSCMHIRNALKLDTFDGLKCDIEGAEWGIIEYFLEGGVWPFEKAVLELHFSRDRFDRELDTLQEFIDFLNKYGNLSYFYDDIKDLRKKRNLKDFNIKTPSQEKPWDTIMVLIEKTALYS